MQEYDVNISNKTPFLQVLLISELKDKSRWNYELFNTDSHNNMQNIFNSILFIIGVKCYRNKYVVKMKCL